MYVYGTHSTNLFWTHVQASADVPCTSPITDASTYNLCAEMMNRMHDVRSVCVCVCVCVCACVRARACMYTNMCM